MKAQNIWTQKHVFFIMFLFHLFFHIVLSGSLLRACWDTSDGKTDITIVKYRFRGRNMIALQSLVIL